MKTKQIVRFLLALLVLIPVVAVSFLAAPASSAAQPLPGSAKAVRSGNVGTFDAEYGVMFEYRPLMPLSAEEEVTYVAEVNGTQYTTLAEAVEKATVGQTIKLITNLTEKSLGENYYVYDLTGKTLDLGGFTYTAENFDYVFEGSGATIKNGKMVCANGGSYALFVGDEGTTDGFVVDSVELTGGINIYNASNVVLKNLKVDGTKFYAVWLDVGAFATIESGTYTAGNVALLAADVMDNGDGTTTSSTFTVQGGTFNTNGKPLFYYKGDIVISGGTFTSEVPLEYCADGFIPEATDDGNGGYTYGVKSTEGYVAALVDEAGTYTCYTTLNDTLNAAAELAYQGKVANIVLLDDITGTEDQYINIAAGMTVTLDLNGQALIGINKGPFIQNHGTLTINDNKGTGRVYTTDVSAQGRAAIANYGTLTINGGYYGDSDNDTTNANSIQRGNALRNYGTATINGGYFTVCDNYTNGGYAYPIANGSSSYPDASLTINYATVYGKVNGVLAADSGTLIVKDGSYTLGYGTETNLFYMIYASGEACVTVAGGEFFRNVNNNYGFFCADDAGAKITISGGNFENKFDGKTIDFVGSGAINVTAGSFGDAVAKGASATVSVAISGGTFTSEVPLALCADGYQSKEQENGTFAVEKMLVYAKNYANSLLIEDIISIRYYFNIESDTYTDEYIAANGGILVWTAEAGGVYTPETASYSIAGLTVWNDENGKHYYATSNGIPAKNMGDVQYACVYVKNTDETYYYSEAFGYSPVTYATNKLASEASSDSLKAFLVSMLNYGAAAQLHFNYNTENLVNSILTEEQKSWSWDDSLLISRKDDSAGKFSFAGDALITLKGWSLSCEGATEINLYSVIDPSLTADAKKMVLLYWSEDAYNSAVTLTAENASGEVVLVYSEEQAAYKGKIKGIAAKDLGDTYYACVCVVGADDTYHYSQLGIYSAHTYVLNKLSSEDATEYLKDLCKTMAIYSDKAKAYFAE